MAEPVEQCDNVPGQVRLDATISAFLIPTRYGTGSTILRKLCYSRECQVYRQ